MSKLVVVDDSPISIEIYRKILDGEFDIEYYEDAESAWESLCHKPCDLLISDINLPQMSGIDLVVKTREASKVNQDIKTIIISSDSDGISLSKKLNIDAWLLKPIQLTTFQSVIEKILAK